MHEFETSLSSRNSFFLKLILCLVLMVLGTRLVELQIVKGKYYRALANDNRMRSVTLLAPRGNIVARGGEILAENSALAHMSLKDNEETFHSVFSEWNRKYPYASESAHIVGYLGEASEEEAGKPDPHCVEKGIREPTSLIGKSGLEFEYDCLLRGVDGEELIEVDKGGKPVRSLGRKEPIPGKNLQTTIDAGLQKVLAQSFGDLPGAAVITDTKGQIFALYSNPSFDPLDVSSLFKNPKLPLFNRAVTGSYHPGSIFKIIVGAAALEDKKITSDFTYTDTGSIGVNGFDYSTWYFTKYGRTEGQINFRKALARSTDTFFYEVGNLVGIDRLDYWADMFGVGKLTHVDLPGETAGLLPGPKWKLDTLGERWYLGNTYHFSIGQGDILVTPLQANVFSSVISNGGLLCPPSITFEKARKVHCEKLPISGETLSEILAGMTMACETGGTGSPFFTFQPKIACKTGTAETSEIDSQGNSVTHAWFTAFGPVENPEISITVLVEKGGEGSSVAAPIAKKVFDYWFHERTRQQ